MSKKLLPKNIWLAGLGAIARAEKKGDEWLEELMRDGEVYESEKKDDLDQALLNMTGKVKESTSRLRQSFDNIEQSFERKVSSTMSKIGLVSKRELDKVKGQLDELEQKLKEK